MAPTAMDPANPNEWVFYLDKNPGEYEVKVLRNGSLSRQATFTVGEDGKIRAGGGPGPEQPGARHRVVLPVKVLGMLDGVWDKNAWKTEAFYGNPPKGTMGIARKEEE